MASAEQQGINLDTLFSRTIVVDALVNYYRRRDPECTEDCETYRVDDFRDIIRASGVNIGVYSASRGFDHLVEQSRFVAQNPTATLIRSAADLDSVNAEKYGVLFYVQKHYRLNGSVEPISEWRQHGLRILQLAYGDTWDPANSGPEEKLAGGADEPQRGLTDLGRRAIRELNRLGMIVDVSHLSRPSVMEAAELSEQPILAMHACARALTDSHRNKTDEELQAIAGTGGVIGVTPIAWMIDRDGDGRGDIDDFVAHVDYIADANCPGITACFFPRHTKER